MCKPFLILAIVLLFGPYPNHAAAQVTGDKSQTPVAGNAEAAERYQAGIKLTEAGQFSEAVENLQEALRLNPQYADAYAALGRAYFKMRDWQKAAVNIRRAMELNKRLKAHGNVASVKTGIPSSATTRPRRTANSTAAKLTPTSPNIRVPQQTSVNVPALKPPNPDSETTRQPQEQKKSNASAPAIATSPQIKPPPQSNANVAAVKPLTPDPGPTRQPKPLEKVGAPAPSTNATTQINLPQRSSSEAAAVRFSTPAFQTTLQLNQPEKISVLEPDAFTTPEIELPQQTLRSDAAAVVRFSTPVFKTTLPHNQVEEVSVLPLAAFTTPEIELPQPTEGEVAAVRFPTPEFKTRLHPNQLEKVSFLESATASAPVINLPQHIWGGAAALIRFSTPEFKTRLHPSQVEKISLPSPDTATTPEIQLPQQTNANVAVVKPQSSGLEATRKPEQGREVSAPAPGTNTAPQIKLSAEVKPLSPTLENTRQSEKREEIIPAPATTTTTPVKMPEVSSAAGVKSSSPESETSRQPAQAATDVPDLKSGHDKVSPQKQDPEAVQVSMIRTPLSSPVETKSVVPSSAKFSDDVSLTKIYRIGPSDVLDVRINHAQSPRSTLSTVSPSGFLEHPTLPEPILVVGLTAAEIATKMETELAKRALIENAKVTVGVRDYASHSVLVSGLVKDPGTKFLRREAIPLYVVVADAQPLPEAAKVTVVRNEPSKIFEIDLTQPADMNLLVRSGDVVTLHRNVTQFIYIGGEVKFPGEKTFRRGLTLTQVIISAGVLPKAKRAEIGRDNGEGFVVETRFSLKDIQSGKAVDPILQPGDRIMVLR